MARSDRKNTNTNGDGDGGQQDLLTAPPDADPRVDGDDPEAILAAAAQVLDRLDALTEDTRIDTINALRLALHQRSPLRDQPVDCVLWIKAEQVQGNGYNPNVVAPPEFELLAHSIESDGYTQPVVAWPVQPDSQGEGPGDSRHDSRYEVVDGFHRHRVGKEHPAVTAAVRGRLPVTVIRSDRTGVEDRMAATIRHNRARGIHTVDGMSEIVLSLSRQGKGDVWIGKELGLDPDEVMRLRQVSGIAEMMADEEFSEAWDTPEVDAWGAQLPDIAPPAADR